MGNGVLQVNVTNFITVGLMALLFIFAANKAVGFILTKKGGGA